MPTTLATYPFLNLLLHPGPQPVLETEWLGFAGSTDFRRALTEALRFAQHHRVTGWVADDRRLGAVRPKDLAWVHSALLVPIGNLGLRRFAHLESAETLNRITIDGMYQSAVPGLPYEFRHFTMLAEARAWAGALS
ncbi:hypothetical protein GO988_15650 [Hymenobacter sp. HMF4947]|uniref:STAS/SEC14 domain-containing protein n=1 Tax=Hymenobacter ginkgonis TaxID=2682976 RepID=A0A7K1THJ1_9BACT|nr:DUF2236 domain-containing protein [Hymenobacter ginkgonis]MVN77766.1 hypothetical protein [Hymenobacter ginkgonis]